MTRPANQEPHRAPIQPDAVMQDHRPASKAPPSTNSEARSLQRPAAIACCFLVLFILYGSLFPFAFHHSTDSDGPVRFLLGTWRDWDRPADLLSNVLLYTPLGFTVFMALPARRPRISPWIVAVLAGSALSVCVELTQYYDVGRVTSMGDVYANTIGSAIGATAAWVAGASAGLPLARELGEHRPEALILVLFLAYNSIRTFRIRPGSMWGGRCEACGNILSQDPATWFASASSGYL